MSPLLEPARLRLAGQYILWNRHKRHGRRSSLKYRGRLVYVEKLRNMDPRSDKNEGFWRYFWSTCQQDPYVRCFGNISNNVPILHCGIDYLQNIINRFVWEKRQKRDGFLWTSGPKMSTKTRHYLSPSKVSFWVFLASFFAWGNERVSKLPC